MHELTTSAPNFNTAEEHKHVPTKAEWKQERIETLKEAFHKGDEVTVNGLVLKVTAVGNRGMTLVYKPERFPDENV